MAQFLQQSFGVVGKTENYKGLIRSLLLDIVIFQLRMNILMEGR